MALRAAASALRRHGAAAASLQQRGIGLVPIVLEQTGRGERAYDIFSRLLKARHVPPASPRPRPGPTWDPLTNPMLARAAGGRSVSSA